MEEQDRVFFLLLFLLFQVLFVAAQTSSQDFSGLQSLTQSWTNKPPNWVGTDPCGSNWDGVICTNSRITKLKLSGLTLVGQLYSAIQSLSELDTVDLSYNTGLTGTIPKEIGNLTKLKSLALVGCGFYGPIPDSIGSLKKLTFLALNSNRFNGSIPRSIGNLSNLNWLDLSDNQLGGPIPVSDDQGQLGLDLLLKAQHFHMGDNKLSGQIPPKLFNSSMIIIHLLFYGNQLVGTIPSTLSLVSTVEIVRFDKNGLTGGLPSNFNNLGQLSELYLSDNKFNSSLPDLSGMNSLTYVDMSNNSFTSSDNIPSWVTSLEVLTTVMLGDNQLSGIFNISNGYSASLQLINLQNNAITDYKPGNQKINFEVILAGNPFCLENGVSEQSYCKVSTVIPSYSTPANNCSPQTCSNSQISSPNCKCAYPYTGSLVSRGLSISIFNTTHYQDIEKSVLDSFRAQNLPVDSVSLSDPMKNSSNDNFQFTLSVFPSQTDRFNRTGVSQIAFVLSNQIYKAPEFFSPYFFIGDDYGYYGGEPKKSSSVHTGVIVGAVVAVVAFLVLAVLAGMYAIRHKRRAQRMKEQNPFANWEQNKDNGIAPQLKGARWFSFDELRRYANNFAEANTIGSGGYGQVYQGVLPSGELVAIKRAGKESMQGAAEFKTEIELLSRVHHKNLVSLVGFCFEKGEQMLVYEYIPNGAILDSLSGKSGIWMDWIRRLKVTLGSAKGLTYLHELANPPIIHRDIKSGNILLDSHLNAKVADFGLSKLADSDVGHVTTQVKGTMGYLDPEYYMTQQLTEKSDVYSFGVLMLELVTARRPIEQGKFIVREVNRIMDTSKDLYNLHSILDPTIIKETKPKGLEKFVELALRCVKEYAHDRPSMADVVKEVENIIELVGLNPNSESASTSEAYDVEKGGDVIHPYGNEDFNYSGIFPSTKVEPK
ncbi:hypothetical protein Lal_00041274 [Lupinus albus]|uniref:non-specific serine/threonine protein kinase n=1 Tax=Lupinus albus TaxID=3870 RepID=A0A6A4P6V2_LUPAL|nr:putative protein kinase RLK-Pelle-LRR-VIII-1 family [Lupinus albus]KAF1890511.1 hypothetical protein Lal_00041274 [Lupinus albus]